jgi:beta-lactamase class A
MFARIGGWLRLRRKRLLLFGGGGILVLLLTAQILYPSDRLLPYMTVDNLNFSGWSKDDTVKSLNDRYQIAPISLYFGTASRAYRTPKPSEIGLSIDNTSRINNMNYPWYLRIVPTSLLWMHFIIQPSKSPDLSRDGEVLIAYLQKELGDSCNVQPINATIDVIDGKLAVVKGSQGGTCNPDDVTKLMMNVVPSITSSAKVDVPVKLVPASVGDNDAQNLADKLDKQLANGAVVAAGSSSVTIPKDQLYSWLSFSETDGKLDYSFDATKASSYLKTTLAAKVAVPAGVTKVATYDFVETSRQVGSSGQALDVAGTLGNIKSFIDGASQQAVAATSAVAPTLQYSRSYSSTNQGLSALMQNYAQSHAGVYGVAMIELSGQNRRASYNSDASFTTASTYKLFVAYSSLKRIESGDWHWSDQILNGQDLTACFNNMIVNSDNACGAALLAKIGYTNITNEAHAIGCDGTSFLGSNGIKTTPDDLALFLAELQSGQILSQQSSRDTLINAMERNLYRQGIPSGIKSATVADKVGFLDNLLHDAAIVYAPSGTYVLVIMTNGSSWANIADLTSQIEALRTQ